MSQDRDAQTFRAMVVPLIDDAYVFARYLTGNASDAEDLVQDAFLRALEYFDSFRGGDPRPWLLTILRNCHRTALGRRGRREMPFSAVDPDGASAVLEAGSLWSDGPDNPEELLLSKSGAERLERAIAELPEAFREAIVLREIHELSYRDIAAVTSVPIGTVMSRLARARDLLRRSLLGRAEEKVQS